MSTKKPVKAAKAPSPFERLRLRIVWLEGQNAALTERLEALEFKLDGTDGNVDDLFQRMVVVEGER
jgi:hypothetical protein